MGTETGIAWCDATWNPWAIAEWPNHDGFVFFGTRPTDGRRGFFWRRATLEGVADSLLHESNISQRNARGFGITANGETLLYASGHSPVRFLAVSLSEPGSEPNVVAERNGGLGIVHHKKFDYRGVIIDVDPVFMGTEEWYEEVARSRPPKDKPWYQVLVHNSIQQTSSISARRSGPWPRAGSASRRRIWRLNRVPCRLWTTAVSPSPASTTWPR